MVPTDEVITVVTSAGTVTEVATMVIATMAIAIVATIVEITIEIRQ